MTQIAYLGLGSNLGNRIRHLNVGIRLLEKQAGDVLRVSTFYESEPWGYQSPNRYVNAVCELRTELQPLRLLDCCKDIERQAGRKNKTSDHYEDRPLDIDILLYGNDAIDCPRLTIPHPRLAIRSFVLFPLSDLIPDFIVPLTRKSVAQLRDEITDSSDSDRVRPLPPLSSSSHSL